MQVRTIAVKDGKASEEVKASYVINTEKTPFLKADGKILKDNFGTGSTITLRGTNAGGWLVTENWQCPVNAKDQLTTLKVFTERFGADKAQELIDYYQDNWWTEEDFDIVKEEGMNVLRLPVTYFEMQNSDGTLKETAFKRLDWFVQNCALHGIYVLIDMHGAMGSQNGKDHSGDTSIADKGNFYDNEENIKKTITLWEEIAKRYKDNPWVCGYDLLNEPSATGTVQFDVYDRLYKAIRAIDKNHAMFIQAIWEPYHLPDPSFYGWQNVVYEYHFYGWDVEKDAEGQMAFIQSKVKMADEDTNYDVPLLVGEFTFFSNEQSWNAMDIFEEQGWSYTSWTYKVTGKNSSWGIFTSDDKRKVDIYKDSYDTIKEKWSKEEISTTSEAFTRNAKYADILKKYFANNAKNIPGNTAATGISAKDAITIEPGKTAILDAKNIPDNTAYKTLYYISSNTNVAVIDNAGMVTAKAEGTAKITITNIYGMSKECVITVKDSSGNNGGNSSNGYIPGPGTSTNPSSVPSVVPSTNPSVAPSTNPSVVPSANPSGIPSTEPSVAPSTIPSNTPSTEPTNAPTNPTKKPNTSNTVKVGKKAAVSGSQYKVTAVKGTRTVQFTKGKKNAKSVTVPSTVKINGKSYKVTVIAKNALKNNRKLTKLTIGKNVKKIGASAFQSCSKLKKIIIKSKKLSSSNIGKDAFKGISKNAVIKVPKRKVKIYKKFISKKGGAGKNIKVKAI